jgi:hypothetical protein
VGAVGSIRLAVITGRVDGRFHHRDTENTETNGKKLREDLEETLSMCSLCFFSVFSVPLW